MKKNQKLKKILSAGTLLLTFFFTACQGGRHVLDAITGSSTPHIDGKRKMIEICSPTDILQSAQSSKKQKRESSVKETAEPSSAQKNAEKRIKDEECPFKDLQRLEKGKTRRKVEKLQVKNLDTKQWNEKRLENSRRKRYKTCHQTVYIRDISDKPMKEEPRLELYQQKLREDIEEFSTHIAPIIDRNAMLFFVASRSINIYAKYKDLWGIKSWLANEDSRKDEYVLYKKLLKSFKGYYPGVIEDIIAYVRKHRPIRIVSTGIPQTEWRKSLGDLYLQETLKPNCGMMGERAIVSQMDRKYLELDLAVRMLLAMSEVHQDFFKISEEFIEYTEVTEETEMNRNNYRIVLEIHKIVQMYLGEEAEETVYEELYSILKSMHDEGALEELTAAAIYKKIYTALGIFYERAPLIDENEYVLAGKCIVTNQQYMKCKGKIKIASDDYEEKHLETTYSQEENRWSILPDVQEHYHVYYLDNTKQQLEMLCMPVHKEDGCEEEFYLHTISDIVRHIKVLYGVKEQSDTIHPFKVKKETREWTYIREKDRNETLKNLAEYEVVFYQIEEHLESKKFTFAEFRPLYSHDSCSICVPLFLTPLMQSAVDLGPFIKKEEHTELDSIYFESQEPSIYKYNHAYKGQKYTDVHKYYSNLYILPDAQKKKTFSCYVMNCSSSRKSDGTVEAVWYVRVPSSVDEYTHCLPDRSFREEKNIEKFNAFIETVKSREYHKDSDLQSIWLCNNSTKDSALSGPESAIYNWQVNSKQCKQVITQKERNRIELRVKKAEEYLKRAEARQKSLGVKHKSDTKEIQRKKRAANTAKCRAKAKVDRLREESHIKLSRQPTVAQAELIVLRNVNHSKSNLGAHNEILDALISTYKCQKYTPINK
ncbi:hypothetical protein NEMIN01_1814 [Nematocida minor]|uniref:uncharacterized protein n=1 Tax=Nematocida minor TaxID=1912983 RepID=UPI0022207C04|nr:uncharacterized protein NEMIN01_1814 [Nematocida minor]KAI5192118.1 hypothetical protein NEMIN01_1814 [Nematocida minor]